MGRRKIWLDEEPYIYDEDLQKYEAYSHQQFEGQPEFTELLDGDLVLGKDEVEKITKAMRQLSFHLVVKESNAHHFHDYIDALKLLERASDE